MCHTFFTFSLLKYSTRLTARASHFFLINEKIPSKLSSKIGWTCPEATSTSCLGCTRRSKFPSDDWSIYQEVNDSFSDDGWNAALAFEANSLFWLGIVLPPPSTVWTSETRPSCTSLWLHLISPDRLPLKLPSTSTPSSPHGRHVAQDPICICEVSRIKLACFPDTSAKPVAPQRRVPRAIFSDEEGGSLRCVS